MCEHKASEVITQYGEKQMTYCKDCGKVITLENGEEVFNEFNI